MKMRSYIMRMAAVAVAGLALTGAAAQPEAQKKLTANAADVEFALTTVESAIKQYNALPDAKKRKLETQVAKAAGTTNVTEVAQAMRTMAASAAKKPIATKESREQVRKFLDANQKWCGTVKAARLARQAMAKMGVKGEMSLDDILKLIPE